MINAITLATAYMGFFGPLLPLGQYALVCYNPNKIRCRSLYYIDGATCDILNFLKNLLSFELLHFSFSLNQKTILWNMPNFQVHIYHLSKFFFVRNLTFLIYCRFSIFPSKNNLHYCFRFCSTLDSLFEGV